MREPWQPWFICVSGNPLQLWWLSIGWAVFVFAIAFLMVSTWRFFSLKGINFRQPQNFRWLIGLGAVIALIWFSSQYVLFVLALVYILAGVLARLSFVFRRPTRASTSASRRGLARLMKNGSQDLIHRVHATADSWGGLFRVAIVGAATLKGRELKEVLTERNFPAHDIRLLDDDESLGQLDAVGDEPTFIQNVLPEHLENVDFTFFASDEALHPQYLADGAQGRQRHHRSVLRLWKMQRVCCCARRGWSGSWEYSSESISGAAGEDCSSRGDGAGSVAAARSERWARYHAPVVTAFEPASEHGRRGMDELHEQTVNLLSFQQLPKSVFDTQVAFNLSDRYGEKSLPSLASVEKRILRHFRHHWCMAS